MKKELLDLLEACHNAVIYVGMANYAERQRYAQKELERVFEAYHDGKHNEVEFGLGKEND